ncbi:LacI family DNA-binding transcriptional regulator [Temperatibacter marinus]|uniref:LacI family DNA-binding transcriptional regulator n=1 Tax=Temperatibacter marinus TaxID=1456591 RepID=A0AA52EJB9_9PROT|nr:LacI family DNA-binding transcriptional regulator [Temperatibacter marinus]WND03582.1 LacI family DNA-binding transcriptional regulator [Temperatibacter marinus]
MATIYEVSKLAGVSLATVSRVINGNEKVRDVTRKKVMKAVEELNYRPNSVAKSLASNKTDSIGILVSELHGPIFGSMMSEIEATLRNAGKHVIFTAGHSDEQSEREGIEFLLNRNCDALILHVEAISDADLVAYQARAKTPFIFLNHFIDALPDNCIYLNNELGGQLSAQALIDKGHKHLAYIAGPFWKQDANERFRGFKNSLEAAEFILDDDLVFEGDYHEDSGYLGMKQILETKKPFTGVACANDEMAAGAMRAIREAGITIPDDISIVGFDNIIFTRFMSPKLTTIHFPIDAMGKMAAQLVMKRLYGMEMKDPVQYQFDPTLIERESIRSL